MLTDTAIPLNDLVLQRSGAREAIEAGPMPASGTEWDVVVIGTGLGGATIGHALAVAGHSVLFLEKGNGGLPSHVDGADRADAPEVRKAGSHWPDRMNACIDGRFTSPYPALGCGPGGSSLLFAATLERFARSDIESVPGLPHPTGGWPMTWADMSAHYGAAEQLYRVAGTIDPIAGDQGEALPSPPSPSAVDDQLMRSFEQAGLHPYRLHVGLGYKPGCGECGGRVCSNRCKSDARLICLEPALEHGATLLADSEVETIEADRSRVTGVVYRSEGVVRRVQGRIVILAAGAYRSPSILLGSGNALWPNGLANGSGLVGRNLMFHANEWFAVWPKRQAATTGPRKTIGLRDLYVHEGVRLGSIQSTGLNASSDNIQAFLENWFDTSPYRRMAPLRPLLRFVARIAQRLFGAATIFVMLIEDFGYAENRVVYDASQPGRIKVEYGIRAELRERVRLARALVRKAFGGMRVIPLQADVQLNLGHSCGTCRAGDDPSASVIDASCKAHELDNLYVVDASFMPTSGGTNPGLTVIANALRVAGIVAKRLNDDGLGGAAVPRELVAPRPGDSRRS